MEAMAEEGESDLFVGQDEVVDRGRLFSVLLLILSTFTHRLITEPVATSYVTLTGARPEKSVFSEAPGPLSHHSVFCTHLLILWRVRFYVQVILNPSWQRSLK